MKIVYIAASPIPARTANSVHVMKMCQAFADLGHDVTLIAERGHDDLGNMRDIYSYYDVTANFRIQLKRRLPHLGKALTLSKIVTAFILRPDYVHGRDILCCLWLARLRIQTSIELHKPPAPQKKSAEKLKKYIKLKNVRQLVVNCHALRNYLIKQFKLPENKLLTAHNGADIPKQKSGAIIKLKPQNAFHIGYIGQLFQGKGMEIILPLAEMCPWAQFHVIGGAQDDTQYWREKADKQGVKNIIFYGHMAQHDITPYRDAFDVMLAPYQTVVHGSGTNTNLAPWTSPIKIFEYMASSKAIVASDLPSLQEVLDHDHNALLCEPDAINQWQAALEHLYAHLGDKDRLSKQAHEDFINYYTWQKRAETILQAI